MAYNPGVSFFIPFHELDPSKQSRCIYFTQKRARCRWSCQESDNRQAIALHKTINATSSGAVSLDLLREYVLCNCCRSGNAQHRDRIEDIGLLIPLARRWQDEIRRHAADQSNHTTSVPAPEEHIFYPYAYTTPTPSHTTTLYTPTAGPFYYQPNVPTSFSVNATPSEPVAGSSYYQYGSPRSSTTTEFAFQAFRSQPRYDLRPREANISTYSTFTEPTSISQPPLSEFRPHVADPRHSDSVSRKILDPLEDRDFETGSLYIFNRASSPGHVKIGWTARSISHRLEDWSKCGYNPNLLFSVCCVPHAQRVETLTHHELIKEWRRERMCKAPWCRKSHKEWFEISEERAAQVLSDWADFMKRAEPYDSEGWLKSWWREVVEMMDGNGEVTTAKKLLERYEESLVEEATLVEELVDLGHAPKIEEEEGFGYIPKVGRLGTAVGSLLIEEPAWPKETPLLKSEALPKQIPLVEISCPMAEKQPKSDQLFKTKPLPKTEPLFKAEPLSRNEPLSITEPLSQTQPQFKNKPPCEKFSPAKTKLFNTEPLPKTQFLFTAQPPFKIEPLSKTGPLFKAESLFRTEPLPKSEPVREEVPAPETTPVKELPPEQIPLPPSPLLQPTTFPQDTLSSQETKPGPRTGTEETSAIDIIANSDTNITVVDTSSNPKFNSSVSPSAPSSLSATTLPSATPSEDTPPQTNTPTSTDTSTTTNSPPLNFSDPSSELNPSATSASPGPKVEPAPDSPAPPVTEISEALLTLSTDEQEELVETLTSTTQRQQNAEGDGQAEPESELFRCDGQIREEEIKSHNQDESTETEKKMGTAGGWDAEATLVEDQIARSLEKVALKNVDGVLDGPKVLESEAPPAVAVVEQL
jgi:hypothetical protein